MTNATINAFVQTQTQQAMDDVLRRMALEQLEFLRKLRDFTLTSWDAMEAYRNTIQAEIQFQEAARKQSVDGIDMSVFLDRSREAGSILAPPQPIE
ncbi:MAG TPA: hypothetical protein VMP01_01415 [Pirellulaceae bacterium]|nr:hypothetical protein [Pirellulaceae bacterium]